MICNKVRTVIYAYFLLIKLGLRPIHNNIMKL